MERAVVHLNIANFLVAIEQVGNAALRDRPVVVAPPGRNRAVVLDVSERAYREGLWRGMPLSLALRRVPGTVVLDPRPELYARAERAMRKLAGEFSPLVEQGSHGHLFLDVTGTRRLWGEPVDLAARLKREFRERLRLDPTTALATSKVVSKVATRLVKPDGFASVPPGDEESFLRPQTVSLLPGVGEKLLLRMGLLGLRRIGQVAELSHEVALTAFGRLGARLRDAARGLDATPIRPETVGEPRVVCERIFAEDTNDRDELAAHLCLLVEEAGLLLRERNMSATRLELTVSFTDDETVVRAVTLPHSVFTDGELFASADGELERVLERRVRVRKLGLTLSRLGGEHLQLELFTPPEDVREDALQDALDEIRHRYGRTVIGPGMTLFLRRAELAPLDAAG